MEELTLLQKIAVWAIPVVFAITLHEVAHGWMALKLGDPTAKMLGRLTINPVKHIDPLGTLIIPGLLLTFGGFMFGWAKPVPITWENLRSPKRDIALVAVAGPLSNLLMALFWVLVIRFSLMAETHNIYLYYISIAGITINTILMLLNMLPIPPLDGGRVATGLLPGRWSWQLSRLEPYGFPILVLLLATGMLGKILGPLISFFLTNFVLLSGISGQEFQYLYYNLI
jgi:Zn-dependent protease